jgi:hypothetical protein
MLKIGASPGRPRRIANAAAAACADDPRSLQAVEIGFDQCQFASIDARVHPQSAETSSCDPPLAPAIPALNARRVKGFWSCDTRRYSVLQ